MLDTSAVLWPHAKALPAAVAAASAEPTFGDAPFQYVLWRQLHQRATAHPRPRVHVNRRSRAAHIAAVLTNCIISLRTLEEAAAAVGSDAAGRQSVEKLGQLTASTADCQALTRREEYNALLQTQLAQPINDVRQCVPPEATSRSSHIACC